jgi:nicotinamidase/pyrazinamidase
LLIKAGGSGYFIKIPVQSSAGDSVGSVVNAWENKKRSEITPQLNRYLKNKKERPMRVDFSHSALVEVDIQNDFCPGYTGAGGAVFPPGALAVDKGDEVIPPLNALAARIAREGGRVAATADWHPGGHISFAASHPGKSPGDSLSLTGVGEQALWPVHCLQGTAGAAFHEALDLRPVHLILRKGYRVQLDSYSAFFENDRRTPTGLEGYFKGLGIETLLIGGLATDYCVLYSALDAVRLGFRTLVLTDAIRAVGLPGGSEKRALSLLEEAGALLVAAGDLA